MDCKRVSPDPTTKLCKNCGRKTDSMYSVTRGRFIKIHVYDTNR